MPYCSKCGVEVNDEDKACPLCNFDIASVDTTLNKAPYQQDYDAKFPKPINMMDDMIRSTRNKIFYTIFIIGCLIMLITFALSAFITFDTNLNRYIYIFTISFLGYTFFLLGYGKSLGKTIIGIGAVSIVFSLLFNYTISNTIYFALVLIVPIIVTTLLIIYLSIILYRKGKHKDHFVFVPIYACFDCAIISVIIDITTQHYLHDHLQTTWSLISSFCFVAFGLILMGLYYKLPKQVKDRLIKFLHI